jgi:hypothetical protein
MPVAEPCPSNRDSKIHLGGQMSKEEEPAIISRGFNDPDAATVFGNIMRFAKRLAFFYFARCARNESHVTAYTAQM